MDGRFVDRSTGEIKRDEMKRYLESEMKITEKAIESFKEKPDLKNDMRIDY